ncbi:helix-turn-helix domain-containing protein [Pseudomarimonas arenosa]|uniref:AraC family transcriptional regulator n=1 Tax=Pseudomarimonas arenosa TaxID=2774145 RepID=A0AAW3ZS22_9GAMM|nr:helix-turn-helix domain-containing protein [Pseudomarimonas arenosa]MBD8527665.1 AraC family transcriptional regulator [Pseudomarimonas arenosa]
MQSLSTLLVGLVCLMSAMLTGHLLLSRTSVGRGLLALFFALFALQSGLLALHLLQPGLLPLGLRAVFGVAIPPLLYLYFARRSESGIHRLRWLDLLHLWPSITVALLLAFEASGAGEAIDAVVILGELAYALALLSVDRASWRGSAVHRFGLPLAAGFLVFAALVDIGIAIELARGSPLWASWGLKTGIALMLLLVLVCFVWAWRDPEWMQHAAGAIDDAMHGEAEAAGSPEARPEELQQLCQRMREMLLQSQLINEFGLTMPRVARRLGVPSKRLSQAVNTVYGKGFRTLLNDWKVERAATQLRDPQLIERSIIDIMFAAGFQTKSSFNKEFALRTGKTPSQYRQEHRS